MRSELYSRKRGVCYDRDDGGNIVELMQLFMVADGLEIAANILISVWRCC